MASGKIDYTTLQWPQNYKMKCGCMIFHVENATTLSSFFTQEYPTPQTMDNFQSLKRFNLMHRGTNGRDENQKNTPKTKKRTQNYQAPFQFTLTTKLGDGPMSKHNTTMTSKPP